MYTVTACSDHGVKVTKELDSFIAYVVFAETCDELEHYNSQEHLDFHAASETDCWRCCEKMVIDPQGITDTDIPEINTETEKSELS